MKLTVVLKKQDADGLGGEILEGLGMVRSQVEDQVFSLYRLVPDLTFQPPVDVTDDMWANYVTEALMDRGIRPLRIFQKSNSNAGLTPLSGNVEIESDEDDFSVEDAMLELGLEEEDEAAVHEAMMAAGLIEADDSSDRAKKKGYTGIYFLVDKKTGKSVDGPFEGVDSADKAQKKKGKDYQVMNKEYLNPRSYKHLKSANVSAVDEGPSVEEALSVLNFTADDLLKDAGFLTTDERGPAAPAAPAMSPMVTEIQQAKARVAKVLKAGGRKVSAGYTHRRRPPVH